jgi:hypothetical protein
MKLTAQQVFDATLTVSQIIRENRPMPQKGSYRLARLHARLLPEFNTIAGKRDEIIQTFDWKNEAGVAAVPPERADEFMAKWKEIGEEMIEVEIDPLPLGHFDLGPEVPGPLKPAEIITLGDLVTE